MATYDQQPGAMPAWRGDPGTGNAGSNDPNNPVNAQGWAGLKSQLGAGWNAFTGDPKGVMDAYTKAIALAGSQGQQTRDWLQQQQKAALAKYGPVQAMFSNMYGTGGMAPAQVPGAIGQTFGGTT